MCHFASFCVNREGEIFVGNWQSHSRVEAGWNLKPGQYREAEWTEGDNGKSLTVRVEQGEDENYYRAIILAKFPTRAKLLASFKTGKTGDATYYFNEKGQRHRNNDKPAIIFADGTKCWYKNGQCHRDNDKPAIIRANGTKFWYENGQLHNNNDKPAIIFADGTKHWYKNGQCHRDNDKPAIIYAVGLKEWYKNGTFVKSKNLL